MIRAQVQSHAGSWEGEIASELWRWETGKQEVVLAEGSTVADLIGLLKLDEQMVCLIAVNGRAADRGTFLADGDAVDLIPPITGG